MEKRESFLSEYEQKLVKSPQFKQWFGDWENDPQNSSKVVYGDGEPMLLYHGTNSETLEFNSGW
jgi:hypothetical protein